MAKHIDLEELERKGLAEKRYIDVNNQYTGPNPLFPGDPTPFEKVPHKEGDPELEITFELQAYRELKLKEDEIVVFGSSTRKWRVVELCHTTAYFAKVPPS